MPARTQTKTRPNLAGRVFFTENRLGKIALNAAPFVVEIDAFEQTRQAVEFFDGRIFGF